MSRREPTGVNIASQANLAASLTRVNRVNIYRLISLFSLFYIRSGARTGLWTRRLVLTQLTHSGSIPTYWVPRSVPTPGSTRAYLSIATKRALFGVIRNGRPPMGDIERAQRKRASYERQQARAKAGRREGVMSQPPSRCGYRKCGVEFSLLYPRPTRRGVTLRSFCSNVCYWAEEALQRAPQRLERKRAARRAGATW
jgi:hypothetical protein